MGSIKKQPGSVNFQNSLTIKDLCLDVSCYFWLLWRSKYKKRNNEFSSGDKIRIIDGPLCGYEGILIEIKGKKKFGVSISCVNLTAVVDLNTSKMEKCDISNNFREVIIFK